MTLRSKKSISFLTLFFIKKNKSEKITLFSSVLEEMIQKICVIL